MRSDHDRSLARRLARLRPLDLLQSLVLCVVLASIEIALRGGRTAWIAHRLGVQFGSPVTDAITTPVAPLRVGPSEWRWIANVHRVLRRWPLDRTCLRQSLLLGWVLRARSPQLVIGVRPEAGAIAAHAWLRVDGVDLDADAGTYAQF